MFAEGAREHVSRTPTISLGVCHFVALQNRENVNENKITAHPDYGMAAMANNTWIRQ